MGQERGERVVVGVNRYQEQEEIAVPILRPDPDAEKKQAARLREHRARRNVIACDSALGVLRTAAQGDGELLGPMRAALLAGATLGEICTTLRGVWGTYRAARPV
jgi:methylmalonyl-CoA mutase N-terminal domain/subunit